MWWNTPLIWATPSAGDNIRTLEEGSLALAPSPACHVGLRFEQVSRASLVSLVRLKTTKTNPGLVREFNGVVAIPGCQLDYIWNELQSRIGRLTSDPYLEAWRSLSGSWFGDLEP